jgi:hypothetical protein
MLDELVVFAEEPELDALLGASAFVGGVSTPGDPVGV